MYVYIMCVSRITNQNSLVNKVATYRLDHRVSIPSKCFMITFGTHLVSRPVRSWCLFIVIVFI